MKRLNELRPESSQNPDSPLFVLSPEQEQTVSNIRKTTQHLHPHISLLLAIIDQLQRRPVPDSTLPAIGGDDRKSIYLEISVPSDWTGRMDMQSIIEREIAADRWAWHEKPNETN